MFTPFILFLGLTVATAIIAHWSDNLGKKLGKKRVSLFGLRPRTTATILTVASSWGIMLFTLAAMLITVAPLRRALFSYDRERAQASREREESKREIEVARRRLGSTQSQYNSARGELTQAQKDLRTANYSVTKSREDAKKAVEAGKKRAEQARKRAEEAEKEATEAQNRVVEAQDRVASAQKRFEVAQNREETARKGESTARGETRSAQLEAHKARELGKVASADLKSSLADLKGAQSRLKTTQGNLKKAQFSYKRASTLAKSAKKAAFKAGGDVLIAEDRLYETKRQITALEAQRDYLQNTANSLGFNDAPIKVNQVFAARVIPASQTPAAIAVQLRQMLRQGQTLADNEEISPNFPTDAKIQLFPLPLPDASGKLTLLEGERLLQRVAREIASGGQTTSIRLVALRNYLASEKLIGVKFLAVPIAPAFSAGDILASTTIDGAQGDARIFASLLDLTDDGRREAEKRGVNPPQSPDERSFYAEGTNVNLFAALRFIENSKARLRVNLVAAKALSTTEPLQVRFEIESGALSAPNS